MTEKSDWGVVFDAATKHWPDLMMKNYAIISVWLESGFSVEADILPVIETKSKGMKEADRKIYAWKFFHDDIVDSYKQRIAAKKSVDEALAPPEVPSKDKITKIH